MRGNTVLLIALVALAGEVVFVEVHVDPDLLRESARKRARQQAHRFAAGRDRREPPGARVSPERRAPFAAQKGDHEMSIRMTARNTTAPTQFLRAGNQTYAYRRFGNVTTSR